MEGVAELVEERVDVVEEISAGSPAAGFVKLVLLVTTGFEPSSRLWSTKLSIQAPPLLDGRAKKSP